MSNLKKIFSLGLLALLALSSGCNQDEESSPILIFLNPPDAQLEANSGENIFINIDARSTGGDLNMIIETIDDLYGARVVLDSSFERSSINFRLDYEVPAFPDSTQQLMIFQFSNAAGDEAEIAKRIVVNRGETFLNELSGVELFSTASTKPNAFSFSQLLPVFSDDTVNADIVDRTLAEEATLSRSWSSLTQLSFVEFNGFNYASATSGSIQLAYENGVRLSRVSDIANSNVYIVGRNESAIAAIQVIAVTDQADIQEDKYTISLKIIED